MTGVPLNVDWQQILLHLLNFTILFGVLYILLYDPVKKFMKSREDHYAEIESRTNLALTNAESSKETYAAKVKAFDEEVKAEKTEMSKAVEAERERRLSAAKTEAEKIVADARNTAEREKTDILASAQKEITDMVTEAMEKLTLEQSASDAFDQFLDAAEGAEK